MLHKIIAILISAFFVGIFISTNSMANEAEVMKSEPREEAVSEKAMEKATPVKPRVENVKDQSKTTVAVQAKFFYVDIPINLFASIIFAVMLLTTGIGRCRI